MKINFSFITSNDFHRLCPFFFVMPKFQYPGYIFKNLCGDCFPYKLVKLSSVWSYIFLLNSPDKKPKQNSSKTTFTAARSQECSPTNRHQPTKLCWRIVIGTLRWLASLHCLLYFLAFDWLRPAVLFAQFACL